MRVRIEIERHTPKLMGMKGRNMRGADGKVMVIHEGSEAEALAEIAALDAAGVFAAPYNFKQARLYDADAFNTWVAGKRKDMPQPFRVIDAL